MDSVKDILKKAFEEDANGQPILDANGQPVDLVDDHSFRMEENGEEIEYEVIDGVRTHIVTKSIISSKPGITDVVRDFAKGNGKKGFLFFRYLKDDYLFSVEIIDYSAVSTSTVTLCKETDITGIQNESIKRFEGTKGYYYIVAIRIGPDTNRDYTALKHYIISSDNRTYNKVVRHIERVIGYQPEDNQTPSNMLPHNTLVYGAPGTGKSYLLKKTIDGMGLKDRCRRVTFYEDYSYEKFVGGYMPVAKENVQSSIKGRCATNNDVELTLEEDRVSYEFRPGVFLEMAAAAWKDAFNKGWDIFKKGKKYDQDGCNTPENEQNPESNVERENDAIGNDAIEQLDKYVIVIEEINRANAASVFGDMFQLLDRDESGLSEYGICLADETQKWFKRFMQNGLSGHDEDIEYLCKDFRIPPNLYLWATMNSADQGVFPLDSAFKRRWSFIYKSVADKKNGTTGYHFKAFVEWGDRESLDISWDDLRDLINDKMGEDGNIEEDRFIGPRFFKQAEIAQIDAFTEQVSTGKTDLDLGELPNPLCEKLYSYLRQDVYRNNPTGMFRKESDSLYKIRRRLQETDGKLGICDVLDIPIEAVKECKIKTKEELKSGNQVQVSTSPEDAATVSDAQGNSNSNTNDDGES